MTNTLTLDSVYVEVRTTAHPTHQVLKILARDTSDQILLQSHVKPELPTWDRCSLEMDFCPSLRPVTPAQLASAPALIGLLPGLKQLFKGRAVVLYSHNYVRELPWLQLLAHRVCACMCHELELLMKLDGRGVQGFEDPATIPAYLKPLSEFPALPQVQADARPCGVCRCGLDREAGRPWRTAMPPARAYLLHQARLTWLYDEREWKRATWN